MMTPTTPPPVSALSALATPHGAAAMRQEPADVRRLSSAQLLGAYREIEIEHGHSTYRLRLTSLGKLILTK